MCSSSSHGSGEGKGPWGGKGPSDHKMTKGWWATDKQKEGHDKGYGKRATPKERKKFYEWFTALPRWVVS